MKSKTIYLYGSDLWNNGAKNEALANYFWSPLSFDSTGAIAPIHCMVDYTFTTNHSSPKLIEPASSSGTKGFSIIADIAKQLQRSQSFTVNHSGVLKSLGITLFKKDHPNVNLIIDFYVADKSNKSIGKIFCSELIDSNRVGWSAKNIPIRVNRSLNKKERYTILLHADATKGCYGIAYAERPLLFDGKESVSKDGGKTFTVEPDRMLKFETNIAEGKNR